MGSVHKFRRRPKNQQQFRGRPPVPPRSRQRRKSRWGPVQALLLALGVSVGGLGGITALNWSSADASTADFECASPQVVDGDTLRCGSLRVRLYGIDAPELPGHCRPGRECTPGDPYASTASLEQLVGGSTLQCRKTDIDAYGRTVARCSVGDDDLSCAQIRSGHAVKRYGFIWC